MKGEGQRNTPVPTFPQAAAGWESPQPRWAPARLVGSSAQPLSSFPGVGVSVSAALAHAACRARSFLSHQR